ncbi:MAG: class I SAM-dependent methyltransferase, partial [Proteobacteria bacterium]|nr:class I SAM-dependent methyltransferase [Pseudomonadota bacterium]
IDNRPEVKPDLVCDVIEGLPYEDNSVDTVRAHDFLEHIPIGKTIKVITEIWRVLKPGGIFDSLTPSTDGRGAFQDPTHVSFWNQNSWLYYSDLAHRNLYGIVADFEIAKIEDISLDDPTVIYTHVIARARK